MAGDTEKGRIAVSPRTRSSMMYDMLFCLMVLGLTAVYYFGLRALIVLVISSAAAVITDIICTRLRGKKYDRADVSALVTGLLTALMLPASVPYHIVVIAVLFAVVAARQAFGGSGHEIFCPSAAGVLFVQICFPAQTLMYPAPFSKLALTSNAAAALYRGFSAEAMTSSERIFSVYELIIGKTAGAMGTTAIAVMLVLFVFMAFRRSSSAIVFFSETAVYTAASLIFAGTNAALYCTAEGMFLFSAAFLSSFGANVPERKLHRLIFGIITGLAAAVFRYQAGAAVPMLYAVILAAPLRAELDRLKYAKKAERTVSDERAE